MKILVISDRPLYLQETVYYSIDIFVKFVSHLSLFFDEVYYCAPVIRDNLTVDPRKAPFMIDQNDKFKIIQLYPYTSVIDYYKKLPLNLIRNFLLLKEYFKYVDVIMLIIPAMNSFLGFFLSLVYKKPVITFVVGDEKQIVTCGSKYKGLVKVIAKTVTNFHSVFYKVIIDKASVSFFLSRNLMKYFKSNNSYFTFVNLISDQDIVTRDDTQIYKIPKTILFSGRLTHEKGVNYLIKAIKLLKDSNFSLILLVCGDGPEKEKLQKLVDDLNLDRDIKFLGFIPWGKKLFEIYTKSDIFILPSLSEGVPKVLLEAMARGLPIIATNVGGIPDIINHMENGILIPPKSPEAIAEAVKLLVKNEELRRKIIKNGYNFVKEHTIDKQAKFISEIIYKHVKNY